MSRHLIDPELVAGLDAHIPATLNAATLEQFRAMFFDFVDVIPKPMSDPIRQVRVEDRYTPRDRDEELLPAILYIPLA